MIAFLALGSRFVCHWAQPLRRRRIRRAGLISRYLVVGRGNPAAICKPFFRTTQLNLKKTVQPKQKPKAE
jgi:hypothetical protein